MSEFELSLDLQGVKELSDANAAFLRQAGKTLKNALTRNLRRVATKVRSGVRTRSSIGRRIWGKNASGLTAQKLVSVIEPKGTGEAIETGLRFRGLPKLIEEGGRTKPHPIKAKRGPLSRIVFEGRRGLVVTRLIKRHPGSKISAHNIGSDALKAAEPEILADVDLSIQNLVMATHGGRGRA